MSERDHVTPAELRAIKAQLAREMAKLNIRPQDPDDYEAAGVKVRGDYYADCAVGALIQAMGEKDTPKRANDLKDAQVYATLSLRDAVLEATATVKEIATRDIEATIELSATMKRAANSIHSAVRRETVKPAEDVA